MEVLKDRTSKLEENMELVNSQLNMLNTSMRAANERIGKLEATVGDMKCQIDKRVIPGLSNIEAVYLSTFERYKSESEKLPEAYEDIAILKKVTKSQGQLIKKHDQTLKGLQVQ